MLEASAGTGKTYALAGLVTRYVAEGVATLDEMLLITFSRAASRELRERVRGQIAEAATALDGELPAESSELDSPSARAPTPAERVERRTRLRDALATFDAATIATTHEFCLLVLKSLGIAGDTDATVTLVESLDDVVRQIVDDIYLETYGGNDKPPRLSHPDALRVARAAVNDPSAQLHPLHPESGSEDDERVTFAHNVCRELERRKRRLAILGFDDLLSRLATALESDDSPARERMRTRWPIVMVDEFQDTDPVQWDVIRRAFGGASTLILIGDPKQAIYGFRGGDIVTYLKARDSAGEISTLDRNWRSDKALATACTSCSAGAALGHPKIVVTDVVAQHPDRRLVGAPGDAPFRLRVVSREGFAVSKRKNSIGTPRIFAPHRCRPRRRHRDPAGQHRHLLRPTPSRQRRRGHRRSTQGRPRLPSGAGCPPASRRSTPATGTCCVEGRRRLDVSAGGVRSAEPRRPGASAAAHDVLRQDRRGPCQRQRFAHR